MVVNLSSLYYVEWWWRDVIVAATVAVDDVFVSIRAIHYFSIQKMLRAQHSPPRPHALSKHGLIVHNSVQKKYVSVFLYTSENRFIGIKRYFYLNRIASKQMVFSSVTQQLFYGRNAALRLLHRIPEHWMKQCCYLNCFKYFSVLTSNFSLQMSVHFFFVFSEISIFFSLQTKNEWKKRTFVHKNCTLLEQNEVFEKCMSVSQFLWCDQSFGQIGLNNNSSSSSGSSSTKMSLKWYLFKMPK